MLGCMALLSSTSATHTHFVLLPSFLPVLSFCPCLQAMTYFLAYTEKPDPPVLRLATTGEQLYSETAQSILG
jgi:hypothetical protein